LTGTQRKTAPYTLAATLAALGIGTLAPRAARAQEATSADSVAASWRPEIESEGARTLSELSDALRALRTGQADAGGERSHEALPDELDLRAELQASAGDVDGAIETQLRAIELLGESIDRLLTLGRLEATRGNHKLAADYFMRACTQRGDTGDGAAVEQSLRPFDVDRARRLVAKVRESDPDDPALRALQIEVLLRAALPWEAAAVASSGVHPDAAPERHLDLALTWRATGRADSCRFALLPVAGLPETDLMLALLELDAGRAPESTDFDLSKRVDWAPPAAWEAVPLYLASLDAAPRRLLHDHQQFAEKWPDDPGGRVGVALALICADLGNSLTNEVIGGMGPYGDLVRAVEALHWRAYKTAWRELSRWVNAKRSVSPGQGRTEQLSPFLNPTLLARFLARRFAADLEALRILARGFEDAGEWAAEDIFLRGLDFTRRSLERRARARWHLRRFESGAALDVLGASPRLLARDAASLRGRAWLQLGDPERALDALERPGAELDPLSTRVRLRAMTALGMNEEAQRAAAKLGLCRDNAALEAGLACAELIDERGEQTRAVQFARQLVARQPDAAEPLLFLSRLERKAASPRRALLAADRALAIAPQSTRVHFARGRALEQLSPQPREPSGPLQAHEREALAAFRAACELAPDFKEARLALARRLGPARPHEVSLLLYGIAETGTSEDLMLRGQAEAALGHDESALAVYAIVEARGELTEEARRSYAELLRQTGEKYDAIRVITPLLQDKEEWQARQTAAADLLALGRTDQALVLLEEAIEAAPDRFALREDYVEALSSAGNTRAALRAALALGEAFPDSAHAWVLCLKVAEAADDREMIVTAAKELVQLSPGSPDRAYWEGWIRVSRGELLAARRELGNAKRNGVPKRRLGRLATAIEDRAEAAGVGGDRSTRTARGFLAQADTVGALVVLESALAAKPGDEATRILLGEIHANRKDGALALAAIAPLIEESVIDVDPRALRVAGLAHNLLGNLVEAEIAFELAIARGIIDPEVHFRLALLRVMRGDMGAAAEDLGGFVDESPESPYADQALDLYLRLGGE